MKLNKDQRSLIADKIMDSANYALTGLVFAQFLTDTVQITLVLLGLFWFITCFILGVLLKRTRR